MIAQPLQTPAQAALLAGLQNTIAAYPFLEPWITLSQSIADQYAALSPQACQTASQIANAMSKCVQYAQQQTSSPGVPQYQYLQALATAAQQMAVYARLGSLTATGTTTINLTPKAANALVALAAWDSVLGYAVPPNIAATALVLVNGVTVG